VKIPPPPPYCAGCDAKMSCVAGSVTQLVLVPWRQLPVVPTKPRPLPPDTPPTHSHAGPGVAVRGSPVKPPAPGRPVRVLREVMVD
jgi:hypothetical protein